MNFSCIFFSECRLLKKIGRQERKKKRRVPLSAVTTTKLQQGLPNSRFAPTLDGRHPCIYAARARAGSWLQASSGYELWSASDRNLHSCSRLRLWRRAPFRVFQPLSLHISDDIPSMEINSGFCRCAEEGVKPMTKVKKRREHMERRRGKGKHILACFCDFIF